LEKEFKDRERGDLSRSRFINAKQSESRTHVHSPHRSAADSRRRPVLGTPRPQAFIGSVDMGCPGKLGHVLTSRGWIGFKLSSTSPCWVGQFLVLDGQMGAVIFYRLGSSRLCCISQVIPLMAAV
jgi:hypothetical protein